MPNTFYIQALPYLASSAVYFSALKPLGKRVWLDSGRPDSHYGRYDILSAAPSNVLENPSITSLEAHVASRFNPELVEHFNKHTLPFFGGMIGYFNYEYNFSSFGIASDKTGLRPSVFGIFDWALIQDHETKRSHLFFLASCEDNLKKRIISLLSSIDEQSNIGDIKQHISALKHNLNHREYLNSINTIHNYILEGDTYQINFSQRFSGDFTGEADALYLYLRQVLPSPFSAYMELNDDKVLSFSPERFIQIQNRDALTQPIKGTAPRGKTPDEDKRLAIELQKSEKNRAENVMIVDLLRNDFSRSCEAHSVKVPSLFALESFPNVHHLVSTVIGKIRKDVSPLTFFERCFPGGSITGAPKKRSMEIIHELEDHPRNIYCGSIAYLSIDGQFDSSITIRTMLVSEGEIFCWGGGGIVADSIAEEEYQESIQKVGILLDALS